MERRPDPTIPSRRLPPLSFIRARRKAKRFGKSFWLAAIIVRLLDPGWFLDFGTVAVAARVYP